LILWARYVGNHKGAAVFDDATRMKLFGFSRIVRIHVEVKNWTSRRGEAL